MSQCLQGKYNQFFHENYHEVEGYFGEIMVWDSRILHSRISMFSTPFNHLMILQYLDRSIVEDVMYYLASQQGLHV